MSSRLSPLAECFIPRSNQTNVDAEGNFERFSTNRINCVSLNARSLRGKINELHDLLYNSNYSIIAINETWLSACVTNGLLDPRNMFNIYRKDRISVHPAGGVCIFVAKSIASRDLTIDYIRYSGVEVVGCYIEICGRSILLMCAYLAPNLLRDAYLKSLSCLEQLLTAASNLEIILVGDFNKPHIDWLNLCTSVAGDDRDFLTLCMDNGLTQLVSEPTRHSNLLDLVLVTDPSVVSDVCVSTPFSNSDHDTVNFVLYDIKQHYSCAEIGPKLQGPSFIWKHANWDALAGYMASVNWRDILSVSVNSSELWTLFTSVLLQGVTQCVPIFNAKRGVMKPKPSKAVHKLQILKRKVWNTNRNTAVPNRKLYNSVNKRLKEQLLAEALQREKAIISARDANLIYKHINTGFKHNNGISPLKTQSGDLAVSDLSKAKCLNDCFIDAGTLDNGLLPTFPAEKRIIQDKLSIVYFDKDGILRSCKKQKNSFSAGPDGLPPVLFKMLADWLAEPLAAIFCLIMQNGELPEIWKTAFVIPIYKGGNSSDPANYRPISLTCVGCKLFESKIKTEMLEHLNSHDIINPAQHGFLSKRSTTTNLLECMADWVDSLENKNSVIVAYIDFKKAFDSVTSSKLLYLLECIGITGKLLSCLTSFLNARYQCVRIGNDYSNMNLLRSGVVQGSTIGPLLFLCYINNITDCLPFDAKSKIFADDVKCYAMVNNPSDLSVFKNILESIALWSEIWQLAISPTKSQIMFLSNTYDHDNDYTWLLGNDPVSLVSELTDLGVGFQNSLKFHNHIQTICNKARQKMFVLFKKFLTNDPLLLVQAYKTYVLPGLNYCSPIWSPHNVDEIHMLESIQRKFTKRLKGFGHLSYKERLDKSGLLSLELIRIKSDLLLCYKMLHNLVKIDFSKLFEMDDSRLSRGHGFKLRAVRPRLDLRRYSYGYRVANLWNNLSSNTVLSASPKDFVRNLDDEDFALHI